MAEVRLSEVNKVYEGRGQQVHAVRDLDLVVEDGEFVSIVGPSGCGKSTTLRMIVGLEKATSGQILFNGALVNDLDPQARNVAMAFENYALYPNFSAEENIGFPLEARGIPKPERRRRRSASWPSCSRSRTSCTSIPTRFPAARSSGFRWRARSSASRLHSFSTRCWVTWTGTCASRCCSISSASTSRSTAR